MAAGLEDECGLASWLGESTMGPRIRATGKEAATPAPLSQLPGPGCLRSLPTPCLFSLLPGFSVESFNSKIPRCTLSFLPLIQGPPVHPVFRGSPKAPWTCCTLTRNPHHIYGSHFLGTHFMLDSLLSASYTHQSRMRGR